MNSLDFLQNINDISDEYIISACKTKEKSSVFQNTIKNNNEKSSFFKMKTMMKIIASTACFVLLIFASVSTIKMGTTGSELYPGDIPMSTEQPMPTMAPAATGAPVTGVPPTQSVKTIKNLTAIHFTGGLEYCIYGEAEYGSLSQEQTETLASFITKIAYDEAIWNEESGESSPITEYPENTICIYDTWSGSVIYVFDNYIQIVEAVDVNVEVGLYEIADENYVFEDFFADFLN